MEDTSYVSLSLEKYNELYDKAKKYDELYDKYKDNINECVDKSITAIKTIFDGLQEQAATTEEETNSYYDVELIESSGNIPKGAKGKLLEPDTHQPYVDWDNHYGCTYKYTLNNVTYENVYAVYEDELKFINEREEN